MDNNAADRIAAPAAEAHAPAAASLGDLAHDTSDYVRAWSALLASESQLARISAIRLVCGALVLPALALAICVSLDGLAATLINRWLKDWSSCIAIVLFANLIGLYTLLICMRRWWRNLSLPRSRGALARLLEHLV